MGRATPWRGHAQAHYASMDLAAICALPVESLAEDDAHLWVWGVNGRLDSAYEVARAWGFRPVTLLTWCKKQPGVGKYLRNNTEHCVFATRGAAIFPEHVPTASWFVWPRAAHSAKPEAFYDLVEQVSPAPRVELFARRNRMLWDTWGNESLEMVEL